MSLFLHELAGPRGQFTEGMCPARPPARAVGRLLLSCDGGGQWGGGTWAKFF